MPVELDATNDPSLKSWIESANQPDCDFPIQNLPFGVFRRIDDSDEAPGAIGIAIGDYVLDVRKAIESGILKLPDADAPDSVETHLYWPMLNGFLEDGREAWSEVRRAVSALLRQDNPSRRKTESKRDQFLVPMDRVQMLLPVSIYNYTDFYCSIHHAANVGSMFRPDNPLLPNYKHLPIGYHGRASSIIVSGTSVRRPMGQTVPADGAPPQFGPSRLLDYELEMGFYIGPGNVLGTRIESKDAASHIFGLCIVNDWSARDVQKWEYQPLGPFNAKNFATTISPWIVTLDALAPYRVPGPPRGSDDPRNLDYLQPTEDMGLDITVEAFIASERMRAKNIEPALISRGSMRDLYWTIAQMLVHHTSTGCNLQPGDLIATGTISNQAEGSRGCLLERTWRGERPIDLPDGTQRKFLQDGDEVILRAYAQKGGFPRIGFGECRGIVLPAE